MDAVKSAARVFEVLSYFERIREPASLKALCQALGFPQSSTTALLKTLTSMGYLTYDIENRVYFPTMKVSAIGDWIHAAVFGSGTILKAVNNIAEATQETVVVVTKNDIYVQYIVTKISSYPIRYQIEEGSMRLMTATVLGWCLMSTLTDAEADNIIRRCNMAAGLPASTNVNEMMSQVRLVRSQGYGYAENIHTLGGATIGLVLPVSIQGQPVVVACGGVAERMREHKEHYLSVLKREAAAAENDGL